MTQNDNDFVEPLDEDNDTPFSPPEDPDGDPAIDPDVRDDSRVLDSTHQVTDNATDIDSHELYDEGLSDATGASEPNAGNAVTGYDPEKDQRNHDSEDAE